jgi:hypothetical protein
MKDALVKKSSKGLKRKEMETAFDLENEQSGGAAAVGREAIRGLIETIKADDARGLSESRHATRKACHQLSEFAKKGAFCKSYDLSFY